MSFYAIIIWRAFTLLPRPTAEQLSWEHIGAFLSTNIGSFVLVIIGIVIAIIYWIQNNVLFGNLQSTDSRHTILSILQLFFLLVFLVSLRLSIELGASTATRAFESFAAILVGIAGGWSWSYAIKNHHLLLPEVTEQYALRLRDRILAEPITAIITLPIAFVGPILWEISWLSYPLVARPDLHPALINLLLEAAEIVHEFGGDFEREGEFPTPKYLDFKLSPEAEQFYKFGPPFLQRYLPFWVAILVSRMTILLLPLVAVVFPFFKLMPLLYRWRNRSRIYSWYSKLRAFDPERHKEEATENLQAYLVELEGIEEKVSKISVPLSFSEELYHLRMHIDMLQGKLKQMIENQENPDDS